MIPLIGCFFLSVVSCIGSGNQRPVFPRRLALPSYPRSTFSTFPGTLELSSYPDSTFLPGQGYIGPFNVPRFSGFAQSGVRWILHPSYLDSAVLLGRGVHWIFDRTILDIETLVR